MGCCGPEGGSFSPAEKVVLKPAQRAEPRAQNEDLKARKQGGVTSLTSMRMDSLTKQSAGISKLEGRGREGSQSGT